MTFTEADLAQLRAILLSGAKTITHSDGRTVTYNTLEDILKAIATVEAALTPGASRTNYASISRD